MNFLKNIKKNTLLTKDQQLIRATYKRNYGDMESLLSEGANPNATNKKEGKSVLSIAIEERVDESDASLQDKGIDLLLNAGANVSSKDNQGTTPLMEASKYCNNIPLMQKLIRKGANIHLIDKLNMTSLFYAAKEGCSDNLNYLLSNGSFIEQRNSNGDTPLMYAIKNGVKPKCFDTIKQLIDHGANVTIESNINKTALNYAEEEGFPEDIIHLIESKYPTLATGQPYVYDAAAQTTSDALALTPIMVRAVQHADIPVAKAELAGVATSAARKITGGTKRRRRKNKSRKNKSRKNKRRNKK
jgi:ankyrin repeat protein